MKCTTPASRAPGKSSAGTICSTNDSISRACAGEKTLYAASADETAAKAGNFASAPLAAIDFSKCLRSTLLARDTCHLHVSETGVNKRSIAKPHPRGPTDKPFAFKE